MEHLYRHGYRNGGKFTWRIHSYYFYIKLSNDTLIVKIEQKLYSFFLGHPVYIYKLAIAGQNWLNFVEKTHGYTRGHWLKKFEIFLLILEYSII